MVTLIFWVLIGLGLFFGVPFILNRVFHSEGGTLAGNLAARGFGILVILWAVLSTSYVHIPDGNFGTVFKVYGGRALPAEKIIATEGENGPQARILAPGWYPELLINVFNDIEESNPELVVEDGQLATLVAKDGQPLRAGQAFADPFPIEQGNSMLDAEVFLASGGQRGPQQTVLPPGKYRLNPYLWDYEIKEATEIPAGFVGVIKSNVHANVDLGTLKASKPNDCSVIAPKNKSAQSLAAPIVPVGCIGVWTESLPPGRYYFHPQAFIVNEIDTRAQVWQFKGGYTRATIDLTVDSKGDIKQTRKEVNVKRNENDADEAVFVKMEGWDVPLELRVVAQVAPQDAACVVASVGGLQQVEDRVLTPSIRAITRDVAGGSYEVEEPKLGSDGRPELDTEGKPIFIKVERPTVVLDLINQRPLIEGEIERRIRPEGEKACVQIREVRLGEPAIPPELLVAVRREQLATQLAKAFIQEQAAQDKRIASEKAKATADQQPKLVEAEIEVKSTEQLAIAAKNQGQGEKDKLALIAEGQKAQVDVLGEKSTVDLRKYELMLKTLTEFFNDNPDVLTTALSNAQKFVPQTQVGSSSGMLDALLGNFLTQQTTTPESVPAIRTQPNPSFGVE